MRERESYRSLIAETDNVIVDNAPSLARGLEMHSAANTCTRPQVSACLPRGHLAFYGKSRQIKTRDKREEKERQIKMSVCT